MNTHQMNWTEVVAVVAMAAIAMAAIFSKGDPGLTVAAAAVGGIAGWLTRGAGKTANVHAEQATIQPDGSDEPASPQPAPTVGTTRRYPAS